MALKAKPIPDGFHTVTAYLTQRDTTRALEFYRRAFGAETRVTMPGPDGKTLHAEVKIGDSIVFMSDENPAMSPYVKAPATAGCVTGTVYLYVPDVDAAFKRAIDPGGGLPGLFPCARAGRLPLRSIGAPLEGSPLGPMVVQGLPRNPSSR